jgi:hypothetical protein
MSIETAEVKTEVVVDAEAQAAAAAALAAKALRVNPALMKPRQVRRLLVKKLKLMRLSSPLGIPRRPRKKRRLQRPLSGSGS